MCICVFIYVYVCMFVYVWVYAYIYMYVQMCACICTVCMCIWVYVGECVYVHASVWVCTCVSVCMYASTQSVYMHVHEVKHPKEMSVGASCQMWWIHELLSVLKRYLIVRILFPLRIWRFHVPLWSSDKPPGTLKPRKQAQILPPEVYRLK